MGFYQIFWAWIIAVALRVVAATTKAWHIISMGPGCCFLKVSIKAALFNKGGLTTLALSCRFPLSMLRIDDKEFMALTRSQSTLTAAGLQFFIFLTITWATQNGYKVILWFLKQTTCFISWSKQGPGSRDAMMKLVTSGLWSFRVFPSKSWLAWGSCHTPKLAYLRNGKTPNGDLHWLGVILGRKFGRHDVSGNYV